MTNSGENTNILFGGVCRVADIPFRMTIRSDSEGVVLGGKLDSDNSLPVGEVFKKLCLQFGITSIPKPIDSLIITEIGFTYETSVGKYQFVCIGDFSITEKTSVRMTVFISITKKGDDCEISFSGSIEIGSLKFNVVFDSKDHHNNLFIATFHKVKSPSGISLHDLIKSVSPQLSQSIPQNFKIDIQEVKFIYSKEVNKESQFLFGMKLSANIDLKKVPVVGDKLPDTITLSLENLQLLFASGIFDSDRIIKTNKLFEKGILPLPKEGLSAGLHISGQLHVMEYIIPINIGNEKNESILNISQYNEHFVTQTLTLESETPPLSNQIKWLEVQKKIGPVLFRRLGVAFSGDTGKISFALDASLALGPIQFTMSELTVSSSLSKFAPVFGLQGFFMSLQTSRGLELGGGFLKSNTTERDSYYGTVIAKSGMFSIKALGGYTPAVEKDGESFPPSFFIYANIKIPIGGPPYLSVKGLVGGFGLNNRLILPSLTELPSYILLPGPKAPKQGSDPETTIKEVLPQMQKIFIPDSGQYWMAAGISFSSFETVNVFAVATVSFETDLQVALIGSCAITLPKGVTKPVVYIEILFMASYSTSTGLLALEGTVSPASYILGDFCKITGDFAFYLWTNPPQSSDGPRAGDFVVSVGGYHPQFNAPLHYPKLSRLGMTFNLSPLQVTGEAYFAMTPAMLMVGACLNAVWKHKKIKAWFKLDIDFIIAWAPFSYHVLGYANIGCSIDLWFKTITASVGANIEIWGPPFGGRVEVDLNIIKFTIEFGEKKKTNPPLLTWDEFKIQFLPADNSNKKNSIGESNVNKTNILKAVVSDGLNGSNIQGLDWIIDPDSFIIRASTSIPANTLKIGSGENTFDELSSTFSEYNIHPDDSSMPHMIYSCKSEENLYNRGTVWSERVHIKPMGKNNLDSILNITLYSEDLGEYITSLTLCPIVENVASALWGEYSGNININDSSFWEHALTGVEISPKPRIPLVVNNVRIESLLFQRGNKYFFCYEKDTTDSQYSITTQKYDKNLEITICDNNGGERVLMNTDFVLNSIIDDKEINERRNSIFQNLQSIGFEVYSEASVECFGSKTILADWPEILELGTHIVES